MKKLQCLLAVVICGAIFSSVAARANIQGYGTAVGVVGLASYSLGDNKWYPLQVGKYLPVGATVRTGVNGEVDIVLGKEISMPQAGGQPKHISFAPDEPVRGMVNYKPSVEQNVIRLTPNTVISIDKLTLMETGADSVSDTELNLKQGKIYASVKKLTGASQYLIKLPNGIAGVRGTLFSISADGSITCYESTGGGVLLSMIGSDGNAITYTVLPGQAFLPGSGTTPLTEDMINALKKIFTSLCTTYFQTVSFSFDHNRVYVSPTQGGLKRGQNGNGQGQNGNGQ